MNAQKLREMLAAATPRPDVIQPVPRELFAIIAALIDELDTLKQRVAKLDHGSGNILDDPDILNNPDVTKK